MILLLLWGWQPDAVFNQHNAVWTNDNTVAKQVNNTSDLYQQDYFHHYFCRFCWLYGNQPDIWG